MSPELATLLGPLLTALAGIGTLWIGARVKRTETTDATRNELTLDDRAELKTFIKDLRSEVQDLRSEVRQLRDENVRLHEENGNLRQRVRQLEAEVKVLRGETGPAVWSKPRTLPGDPEGSSGE